MLQPGTWIRSLEGETARDENDVLQSTGPNALGCVRTVDLDDQGKPIYGVIFRNNVWVFLDDNDLADTEFYEVPAKVEE